VADPAPTEVAGRTPVLELRDVSTHYGLVSVLRNVNVEIFPGEMVCLLGGNASGKTTTLKTILGYVHPSSGSVLIDGDVANGLNTTEIVSRGVSMVPENRRLFHNMTVAENLEMGAYLRRDAGVRGDIEALFVRFPVLAAKRTAPAGTLSGGQQQILEMAISLLLRPRLLLVDEPSLGLDPRMVELVFDTIVTINREGTAVLMVEQNAKKALAVSHRGFVLELGRNRFEGTGQELLDDPDVRQHYLGGT
jgi:branched-chain amino acid transport system ATP-binding protein